MGFNFTLEEARAIKNELLQEFPDLVVGTGTMNGYGVVLVAPPDRPREDIIDSIGLGAFRSTERLRRKAATPEARSALERFAIGLAGGDPDSPQPAPEARRGVPGIDFPTLQDMPQGPAAVYLWWVHYRRWIFTVIFSNDDHRLLWWEVHGLLLLPSGERHTHSGSGDAGTPYDERGPLMDTVLAYIQNTTDRWWVQEAPPMAQAQQAAWEDNIRERRKEGP